MVHCFTVVKVKTDKRNMEIKFSAIKLGFIQEQTPSLVPTVSVLIIVVVIAIYLICCTTKLYLPFFLRDHDGDDNIQRMTHNHNNAFSRISSRFSKQKSVLLPKMSTDILLQNQKCALTQLN